MAMRFSKAAANARHACAMCLLAAAATVGAPAFAAEPDAPNAYAPSEQARRLAEASQQPTRTITAAPVPLIPRTKADGDAGISEDPATGGEDTKDAGANTATDGADAAAKRAAAPQDAPQRQREPEPSQKPEMARDIAQPPHKQAIKPPVPSRAERPKRAAAQLSPKPRDSGQDAGDQTRQQIAAITPPLPVRADRRGVPAAVPRSPAPAAGFGSASDPRGAQSDARARRDRRRALTQRRRVTRRASRRCRRLAYACDSGLRYGCRRYRRVCR